jgi:hypothetical protein
MSQPDRDERIVRMKLQTAKILWGENRKDAAFLVMESIDDPRADTVREKMFPDNYEVGQGRANISTPLFGIALVVVTILAFGAGFLISPGGQNSSTIVPATIDNQISVTSTPAPNLIENEAGNDLSQVQLTGTASGVQATLFAVQTANAQATAAAGQ